MIAFLWVSSVNPGQAEYENRGSWSPSLKYSPTVMCEDAMKENTLKLASLQKNKQ